MTKCKEIIEFEGLRNHLIYADETLLNTISEDKTQTVFIGLN